MEFVGLFLNKSDTSPLYYQLYSYFVSAVRAGSVAAGERLPGKRTAAAQLGVSVNTVDTAYQMLAAEGYIQAKPRSGFVACRLEQLFPPPAAGQPATPADPIPPQNPTLPWRHSFASGDIDTTLFPQKTWARLSREVLSGGPSLFSPGDAQGDAPLRQAIATYLRGYRGVRCSADQLVVGAGLEVLLGMLARLYPGATAATETPGYPKMARILENSGIPLLPLPVDEHGLQPHALRHSGATFAYLTPSHQFPTGGVMPVGRRTELLAWAAASSGIIVEDDYDSEFRFDGRPLPSLQGLDTAGRVVYAGTFSRSLAPGLRAAYLVLPAAVLEKWRAAYSEYACTVSRPDQHTLARFMSEGHFARSLNHMRAVYKHRRSLVLAALQATFPSHTYTTKNTHTGLYFLLCLPGQNAVALAHTARAAGLRIRAVDEYRTPLSSTPASPGPTLTSALPPVAPTGDALIFGYGGLADAEVSAAITALAVALAPHFPPPAPQKK